MLRREMKHKDQIGKLQDKSGVRKWGKVNKKLAEADEKKSKVIGGTTGMLIGRSLKNHLKLIAKL